MVSSAPQLWSAQTSTVRPVLRRRYVVGTVCTLLTGLMENSVEFQEKMDVLMSFMQDNHMSDEMRDRASGYCFYRFKVFNSIHSHNDVVDELLSPAMRRDVAYHMYGKVLEQVPMFVTGEKAFISAVAFRLLTATYSPMECVPSLRHNGINPERLER